MYSGKMSQGICMQDAWTKKLGWDNHKYQIKKSGWCVFSHVYSYSISCGKNNHLSQNRYSAVHSWLFKPKYSWLLAIYLIWLHYLLLPTISVLRLDENSRIFTDHDWRLLFYNDIQNNKLNSHACNW